MEKKFTAGAELLSGTYYIADKKEYHIYPEDTVKCTDKKYFALHKNFTAESMNAFVNLKNKRDITLDFNGAQLIFHGKIQPFLIDNCENITIKNCSISYARAPYTEFEIVERGEDYIYLKNCNESATYYVDNGYLIMTGEDWENRNLHRERHFCQAFDKETREGKGLMLVIVGKEVERDPKEVFEVRQFVPSQCGELLRLDGKLFDGWTVGTVLCYTHEIRTLSSVYMFDSDNITVENYRIINGAGIGISANHTNNVYVRGLKLFYDEKSNGIIANAADAVHAIACGGDFEMTDCIFEGMVDDAVNIHGTFFTLDRCKGNVMYLKNPSFCSAYLGYFRAGDTVAVYNGPTVEKAAEYTVKSFEVLSKESIRLEMNEPIGAHSENDLIENLSCQSRVTVKNCRFGKANSHIRLQSRGKILFENCEIGLPVLLTGDASYWFESSPVQDLTFKNVSFNTERAQIRLVPEIMPTKNAPYYHKNVRFTDCDFKAEIPIEGGYTDNIVLEKVTNSENKPMKLVLTNCGKAQAEGIEIERRAEEKTELKVN